MRDKLSRTFRGKIMISKQLMASSQSLFTVQMVNEAVLSVFGNAKDEEMQKALLAIRSMLFDVEATLKYSLNALEIDDIKKIND